MNPLIAWWISTGLLVALWWIIAFRSGPRVAIGVVAMLATLVAAWCKWDTFGGMHFFVRDAALLACLGSYCLFPGATFPWKLGWLDAVALCWVVLHGISDGFNESWSWIHFARSYVEWAVPYLSARLAFQEWDDLLELVPWGASIAAVLGAACAVEAIFAIHPWEWVYGYRADENFGRDTMRWGLYRPWGPTSHAIYFGFIQLMLLPWAGMAAAQSLRGERSAFWLAPLLISLFGIGFSLSRGPLVGACIVLVVVIFLLRPRWRIAIGIASLFIALLGAWQSDRLMNWVERVGDVSTGARRGQLIEVDGKKIEYSGTKTRFVIFSLYRRAMAVAGWTGYGTARTSVFPPQVPMGTDDRATWSKVRFVDNCYVLMTLRFGWLGGLLFTGMVGLAIASWWRVAWSDDSTYADIWIAATLIAIALVMATVWLAHDYKFLVFWWIGAASAPLTRPDKRRFDQAPSARSRGWERN